MNCGEMMAPFQDKPTNYDYGNIEQTQIYVWMDALSMLSAKKNLNIEVQID